MTESKRVSLKEKSFINRVASALKRGVRISVYGKAMAF